MSRDGRLRSPLNSRNSQPIMSPTSSLSALCVEVTISFIIEPLGPGSPVRSVSAISASVIARIAMRIGLERRELLGDVVVVDRQPAVLQAHLAGQLDRPPTRS